MDVYHNRIHEKELMPETEQIVGHFGSKMQFLGHISELVLLLGNFGHKRNAKLFADTI